MTRTKWFTHHFPKDNNGALISVVALSKNDFESAIKELDKLFYSVPQPCLLEEAWEEKKKELIQ